MAANKKNGLSKNEWLLMQALWESDRSLAVSELVDLLSGKVDWSYPTYATQLERLVKSGFVGYEKRGRSRFYYPERTLDECVEREKDGIFERMTPDASAELILTMVADREHVSSESIMRLRQLIDDLEGDPT